MPVLRLLTIAACAVVLSGSHPANTPIGKPSVPNGASGVHMAHSVTQPLEAIIRPGSLVGLGGTSAGGMHRRGGGLHPIGGRSLPGAGLAMAIDGTTVGRRH
jgi:hypothetical protein